MIKSSPPLRASAPPRFATPRPTGPTYGPAICRILEMMGTPPMPWQEWAADVIGEIDPLTGLRRHSLVVISVPRQSGKTHLIGAVCLQRIMQHRKAFADYTAQTGQYARKNWLKFTDELVDPAFPLESLFSRNKSQGAEALIVGPLRSVWTPHPPGKKAGHGDQSDLSVVDEAWVFDEVEGAAIIQGITPTHATRPGAQTIILSTRGDADSAWFHGYVDDLRSGKRQGALLDWGIGAEVDATDIKAVAACHPAVGYTQSLESLIAAYNDMGNPEEFARAYGNRETASHRRHISEAVWEAARAATPIPQDATPAWGVAVSADRDSAAIVAGALVDGTPTFEVVDVRPGYRWAIPRLSDLIIRHGGTAVYDAVGASDVLNEAMKKATFPVTRIRTRELSAACGNLYNRLTSPIPEARFWPDQAFDNAAEVAVPRDLGDSWVWDRKKAHGSIAALEAATLALHGLDSHIEDQPPEIFIP